MSAILDAGSSINLYMFHGGTNFGFINGAMHFHEYKSDVTSYGKCPQHDPARTPHVCVQSLWDPRLAPFMRGALECLGKGWFCLDRRL